MKINKGLLKKMIAEEMARFSANAMSEQEEEQGQEQSQEQPQEEGGGGLVDINAGPEEVLKKVPQMLKDPKLKAILGAGQTDGDPDDDAIQIRGGGDRVAKSLSPTQSQIGAGQSLDDQASDNDFGQGGTTNLDRAIAGGRLASRAGLFPILVYKNHILDGHHRWSQFMATNPNASVDVAEIIAPGVKDAEGALALLHYMNFALFGQSPTKDFEGANIYGMDANALYKQALSKMADSTVAKLSKAGLIDQATPEAAAKHFAKNLAALAAKGPGSKPRLVMPQPGDAGSEDGYATSPEAASAGKINYINPKQSDVKESKKDMLKRIVAEEVAKMEIEAMLGEERGSMMGDLYRRAKAGLGFGEKFWDGPNGINQKFKPMVQSFIRQNEGIVEVAEEGGMRMGSYIKPAELRPILDAADKLRDEYEELYKSEIGSDDAYYSMSKDQAARFSDAHDLLSDFYIRTLNAIGKISSATSDREYARRAKEREDKRMRDLERERRQAAEYERDKEYASRQSSSSRKSGFDKWQSGEGDNYNYMTRMENLSKIVREEVAKLAKESKRK